MTRYSPRTGQPTTYQVGPYDSAHMYVQWGGKLPGGEIWSNGVRFADTGGTGMTTNPDFTTQRAAFLASVATAIQTFHTTAGSMISQAAKLSFVKANVISTAGAYAFQSTQEQVIADVGGPNSGDPLHPNQVALAVSWTTGVTRGPAHRGRFFLPLPSALVDANGLITTTVRDSVKTRAQALLTALNAAHADLKVAVFSRKAGLPAHRLVTGIEVGRVLDTQRRRRNKMLELY